MSFAPVTAVAIVAATVIRTGSQMAFVWTVIHGSAAMSSSDVDRPDRLSEGIEEADPLGRGARGLLAGGAGVRTAGGLAGPAACAVGVFRFAGQRIGGERRSVAASRLGAFGPLGAGHGLSCGLGRMVEGIVVERRRVRDKSR